MSVYNPWFHNRLRVKNLMAVNMRAMPPKQLFTSACSVWHLPVFTFTWVILCHFVSLLLLCTWPEKSAVFSTNDMCYLSIKVIIIYLDSGRKYLVKVRVDIVHMKDVDWKRSQLISISKACAQTEYNPRIFFKNMQNKSSWIIRWKKTWNLTKEGAEKRMWKPAWLLYHCRALSQHNLVLSHLFEIRKTNKCTQNTSLKRADKSKRYVYFLTLTAKLNARLENRAKYSMTTTMSIREKPRRSPE